MKILVLIQLVKAVLCAFAIALVWIARLYDLKLIQQGYRWVIVCLVALAAVGIPAYYDFGQYPKHGSFLNPHDFFHYYLGSKYSREIGYENIYNAVVVANTENHGKLLHKTVRRQDNYEFESAEAVMRRAEEYKALFTAERWQQFKRDVRYVESITKSERWPGVVGDKGYNASPTWNMVAGLISNYLAPASPGGFFFLVSLDILLVIATLVLVYYAFGVRTMLFVLIFFAAHYTVSFPHIRGAYMRLDWVTGLVMGLCLIKLDRYKTAGGLMAYAAMARIFPVIFVAGLGCKFIWHLYQHRQIERKLLEFFCVFTISCTVLIASSVVYDGGIDHWKQFIAKISMHDEDMSPVRVGFKYVYMDTSSPTGSWSAFERAKLTEFNDDKFKWYGLQAVLLAVFFFACKRLEAYEAVALGYVPVYFLTAPTFYYHIMLLVPFFLFIPKIQNVVRATGAAIMFGLCILWYALLQIFPLENATLSFDIALSLMFLCMFMLATGYLVNDRPHIARENPPAGKSDAGTKKAVAAKG